MTTIIHPTAIIGKNVSIGEFCMIGAGVVIRDNVKISNYVEIRDGCKIGEGTSIGARCTFSAGSVIGRNCVIKYGFVLTDTPELHLKKKLVGSVDDWAMIGANVCLMPGFKIGKGALVGANSQVRNDIPEGETWFGIPAKKYESPGDPMDVMREGQADEMMDV